MSEPSWYGCVLPADLSYDVERHVWVRWEGDELVVGMTDVSQTMCGRFVQISWKQPGRTIARGRSLAVVESAKWVGPVTAPLTGVLVANNEETFGRDIAAANRDPYGAGWLVRIAPTDLDNERALLQDGAEAFDRYRGFIDENEVRCFRCAD